MRKAIGVAIIKDGRILLVKKQEVWILPGGKPEMGEPDIQCLLREVKEELPKIKLSNLKYFGSFVGITPHTGDELIAEVYLADADGEITPSAEISKAEYVGKPEKYNLSDITSKIVVSLRRRGFL